MKFTRPLPRQIKFTKEGLESLKAEYNTLLEKRPAAVLELKRAREMGDLSENGLYKAARMNLSSIDANLRRMSRMIKLADVQDSPTDSIGIGSRVVVEQNGEEVVYSIVGDYEANPSEKKISSFSPIGRALSGKNVGEIASIQTPKGELKIKILKTL
ncbi:MAG TPA: transcription elongation factor GreA [Patescibacteria group bacterium]|nr:transcription elongation factor GreA [Patescibacteria group bacterium]